MGIGDDELQVPITQEVRNLVQRAYDAGCARGREEMLALQGLDAGEVGDDVRRLRRHLAELKEIVSLDADMPGDEQRVEMIKELLTRWKKIASIIIREAIESHFQTRH
ncbi:MAG: hypothetical protein ACLPKT_08695 [Methylocella sp.]